MRYFDYAAATPVDPGVVKVMRPYLTTNFYNPSALYEAARNPREALANARATVAGILGAKPVEIFFTAGATESINLAVGGVAKRWPSAKLVVSAIEHEAVLAAGALWFSGRMSTVAVKPSGLVEPEQLARVIDDETVLVSVMLANNEIGTVQPLARIAKLITSIQADRSDRGIKLPLYLHTDASQAANYLSLSVQRLGVDLLTLNGGKIYGPKQTGCLYVRGGVELSPILGGGGQERGIRPGTENVAGAVGFAAALELAAAQRVTESVRQTQLREQLLIDLKASITDLMVNGDLKQRLPNNLNLLISGINGETLVHHLDAQGFAVATGAACSANKDQPSHVLLALGLSEHEANSSLRLSLGRGSTEADIKALAKALPEVVTKLRSARIKE